MFKNISPYLINALVAVLLLCGLATGSVFLFATGCVTAAVVSVIITVYTVRNDTAQASKKYKLYCIVAKESLDKMNGSRGKLGTQCGHGYLHAVWDSMERFPSFARHYRQSKHAYKITLVVQTVDDLKGFEERYRDVCGVSLVTDAGFTVFKNEDGTPNPTTTCLGIGPIPEDLIGDDLRALKVL